MLNSNKLYIGYNSDKANEEVDNNLEINEYYNNLDNKYETEE